MMISFFSNYLSPHQLPFCDEMYRLIGDDFFFVSCEPISSERINMGWPANIFRSYDIHPYEADDQYQLAKKIAIESDLMIWGSARREFVDIRVKTGKVFFRYSERLIKKGLFHSFLHLDFFRFVKNNWRTRSKNAFLLSASSYAPKDFRWTLGRFERIYRWGYYPETREYSMQALFLKKRLNDKVSILWVGRLIQLKHPELCIDLGRYLKKKGYNFSIKIVGDGVLAKSIKKDIEDYNLSDCISMIGAVSTNRVREYMESANIFIITSDYNEGWGAVLNEAMNSGCAVVCSRAIGAADYLIKNNVNGIVYRYGNVQELRESVCSLIDDPSRRIMMGENAYRTIKDLWSAEIAAYRIVEWTRAYIEGKVISFEDGPLSVH